MSEDAREWVLDRVTERIEEGDEYTGDARGRLWTSVRRLREDTKKFSTDHDTQAVAAAVDELYREGELFIWFGCVTPANRETLVEILEHERDGTRRVLSRKIGRTLARLKTEAADA